MTRLDLYVSLGAAIELLAASDYHREFPLRRYLTVEILPPLRLGQAKIYFDGAGHPTALVTWAWLTDEAQREIHTTGRALRPSEWQGGPHPFFNDWIALNGSNGDVLRDMRRNVFPDAEATSLRRAPDGTVRRIDRWRGVRVAAPKRKTRNARILGGGLPSMEGRQDVQDPTARIEAAHHVPSATRRA